jgi:hypothetical protein
MREFVTGRRLRGCAVPGEQEDGGEQRRRLHGDGSYGSATRWSGRPRGTRRPAPRWPAVASALGIALAQQPNASASEAAAVEVIDRKRSPPRSSTPTHVERRLGHLGLGRSAVRGRAADATCRFLQAGFDVAHARLQRLQVDRPWALAASASSRLRQAFVQRLRALPRSRPG